MAQVASYDDAPVSLTAEVASAYVNIRTYQERLRIARATADAQAEALRLATVRFRDGETSETDVEQARSEYAATRSQIPQLEIGLGQNQHALRVLLGRPPAQLDALLGAGGIPAAPPEVVHPSRPPAPASRHPRRRAAGGRAVRHDWRHQGRALPRILAQRHFRLPVDRPRQFEARRRLRLAEPGGLVRPGGGLEPVQLRPDHHQVREQDAAYQGGGAGYQNAVLQAQQEVEDGLASFLGAQQTVALLQEAVAASRRSVDLATVEYREGASTYTTVLTAQQSLLVQQDQLAVTRGSVAQKLISLYRALGGGWQTRADAEFVSAAVKEEMAQRTDWGGLLQSAPAAEDIGPVEIRAPAF